MEWRYHVRGWFKGTKEDIEKLTWALGVATCILTDNATEFAENLDCFITDALPEAARKKIAAIVERASDYELIDNVVNDLQKIRKTSEIPAKEKFQLEILSNSDDLQGWYPVLNTLQRLKFDFYLWDVYFKVADDGRSWGFYDGDNGDGLKYDIIGEGGIDELQPPLDSVCVFVKEHCDDDSHNGYKYEGSDNGEKLYDGWRCGGYSLTHVLADCYGEWIDKKKELWLLQDCGDAATIAEAENDLAEAKQKLDSLENGFTILNGGHKIYDGSGDDDAEQERDVFGEGMTLDFSNGDFSAGDVFDVLNALIHCVKYQGSAYATGMDTDEYREWNPKNVTGINLSGVALDHEDGKAVLDLIGRHFKGVQTITGVLNGFTAFPSVADEEDGGITTIEKALAAVREDGYRLEFVPEKLKTAELCLAAVQRHMYALEHVPEALRTAEICLAAVQRDMYALEHVPEALRTAEICLAAVQKNGFMLGDVPEALKTAELCLAAVQSEGNALIYVPEALKTAEICLAAVQESGRALEIVPEALKTADLCLTAVQEAGYALEYVPEALQEQVKKAAENSDKGGENDSDDGEDDIDPKALTQQGVKYLQHSDFENALQTFNIVLNRFRAHPGVLYYRAYTHRFLGQFDKALADITRAIELDPNDVSFLNQCAYIHKDMGQFANAIADMNKALELKPDGFTKEGDNLYDTRAEMYEAAGEYQKAIADARKALELNPKEKTSKQILSRCEAALQKAPAAKSPASGAALTCAKCGGALRETSKFCPHCGTKVEARPPAAPVCKNCGSPLRETANFCGKCGTKVEK